MNKRTLGSYIIRKPKVIPANPFVPERLRNRAAMHVPRHGSWITWTEWMGHEEWRWRTAPDGVRELWIGTYNPSSDYNVTVEEWIRPD